MTLSDASPEGPVADVFSAVQACVDARGSNAASVSSEDGNGLTTISVVPANPKAASVTIRMTDANAVLLTFGRTSVEIAEEPQERILQLQSTLRLIFDGQFTEFGPGHAQSQFRLKDGTTVRMGAEKSSLQRRFGPKQHYEPYD
jgi:hypothetical protein